MPSKFFYKCDKLDQNQANKDMPAEVLMMVNNDSQICLMTHDADVENFTNVGFTRATEQLVVYSEEHPCGELLDYAVDEKLKQLVKETEEILYVNINSKKGEIIQEKWLPLEVMH